jgi:hypothetical protein
VWTIKDFALWAIFLAWPLKSKLYALCGGNANLILWQRHRARCEAADETTNKKRSTARADLFTINLEIWL